MYLVDNFRRSLSGIRLGNNRYLLLCVLIMSAGVSLLIWRRLPIYPDEIAVRIWLTRAPVDGWMRLSSTVFCESSALVQIPAPFLPVSALFSTISMNQDYRIFRFATLGLYLSANVAFFAFLIIQIRSSAGRVWSTALFLGLLSGVHVSTVGIFRPEFFIGITVLAGFTIFASRLILGEGRAGLSIALIFSFAVSVALYAHPKALYFVPLYWVIALTQFNRRVGATCAAYIGWTAFCGFEINSFQYLHCPEAPDVERLSRSFNIDPLQALSEPALFLTALVNNIADKIGRGIFYKSGFLGPFDLAYLPELKRNLWTVVVDTACRILWSIGTLSALFGSIFLLFDRRTRVSEKCFLFAFWLALGAAIFLNRTHAFYDNGFWLWMLMIGAVWVSYRCSDRLPERFSVPTSYILLTISIFTFGSSVNLVANKIFSAFSAGYAGPSVPVIGVKSQHRALLDVMGKCGIAGVEPRIVHDDFSYRLIQRAPHPIAITYSGYLGRENAARWWERVGAVGIVAACSNLQPYLTHLGDRPLHRAGDFCCMRLDQPSDRPFDQIRR